jgi:predicted enzyme related to lactoylglutathione lyase
MDSVGRVGWIQIDCADPVGLATFWGAILGQGFDEPLGDPVHYLGLVPSTPGAPVVSFQRVPEAKTVKNRLHLDVVVEDVEAAVTRVVELGGSVERAAYQEYGFSWRLAADPEGNEFCLIF